MANYATGTAAGPGAVAAFFAALRTHLLANGWTEHEIIVAGSDVVFRGAALEAVSDIRPFLRLTTSGITSIIIRGYSDYDPAGAGTGIAETGGVAITTLSLQDASFAYYLWFDGLGGTVVAKIGSALTRAYLGFARRGLDPSEEGITKSTGALAIGATSIPVASDLTGKLRVGQKVQVMNYAHTAGSANATNCESVTVTSVAAGSIGVSALTKNYDSGAVVGENVCPLIVSNTGSAAGTVGAAHYAPYNLDGSRTGVNAQTVTSIATTGATEANVDPGDIDGRYGWGLITFSTAVASKTGFKGYPRGIYGCASGGQSIEDLMAAGAYTYLVLDNNSGGSVLTILGPRET